MKEQASRAARHPSHTTDEEQRATPTTGAERLRAALRRIARRSRALARQTPDGRGGLAWAGLSAPQPETEWERAAEARLRAIERQLTNQNRLLLFTCISIVADLVYGFTK
jgi:hypothetical protein